MNFQIIFLALLSVVAISISALEIVHTSVGHIHSHHPFHDTGFWKKKWSWKSRWVKQWRARKVWVAVWKRVWGPVQIKEWVPYPPKPVAIVHEVHHDHHDHHEHIVHHDHHDQHLDHLHHHHD